MFLGEKSYIIYIRTTFGDLVSRLETNENFVIANSLLPGTTYEVTVQSVGPQGDLSVSPSLPLIIETRLLAPENLETVSTGSDFIEFKWVPVEGL